MRAWHIPFFLLIKLRISDAKKVIARRHACPTWNVSIERKIFTGGHRGDLFHAVGSKVLGERSRDLAGWVGIVIGRLGGFHNGDLGGLRRIGCRCFRLRHAGERGGDVLKTSSLKVRILSSSSAASRMML